MIDQRIDPAIISEQVAVFSTGLKRRGIKTGDINISIIPENEFKTPHPTPNLLYPFFGSRIKDIDDCNHTAQNKYTLVANLSTDRDQFGLAYVFGRSNGGAVNEYLYLTNYLGFEAVGYPYLVRDLTVPVSKVWCNLGLIDDETKKCVEDLLSQTRIPRNTVAQSTADQSLVRGVLTAMGLNLYIGFHLQDPNDRFFLKCFEVELSDAASSSFMDNTVEFAPESIWQADERHFCLTDSESYPFVPVKIPDIADLGLYVTYNGDDGHFLKDVVGEMPLSVDGGNQWYAQKMGNKRRRDASDYSKVHIFHKPEWGYKNTALVYDRWGVGLLTPKVVAAGLKEIDATKKLLTND